MSTNLLEYILLGLFDQGLFQFEFMLLATLPFFMGYGIGRTITDLASLDTVAYISTTVVYCGVFPS